MGIEPTTATLATWRSTAEPHPQEWSSTQESNLPPPVPQTGVLPMHQCSMDGRSGWSRTTHGRVWAGCLADRLRCE